MLFFFYIIFYNIILPIKIEKEWFEELGKEETKFPEKIIFCDRMIFLLTYCGLFPFTLFGRNKHFIEKTILVIVGILIFYI